MLKENLTPTIIKEKVSQFLKNNGTIYTEEKLIDTFKLCIQLVNKI